LFLLFLVSLNLILAGTTTPMSHARQHSPLALTGHGLLPQPLTFWPQMQHLNSCAIAALLSAGSPFNGDEGINLTTAFAHGTLALGAVPILVTAPKETVTAAIVA
jgi:hypothetical protein